MRYRTMSQGLMPKKSIDSVGKSEKLRGTLKEGTVAVDCLQGSFVVTVADRLLLRLRKMTLKPIILQVKGWLKFGPRILKGEKVYAGQSYTRKAGSENLTREHRRKQRNSRNLRKPVLRKPVLKKQAVCLMKAR